MDGSTPALRGSARRLGRYPWRLSLLFSSVSPLYVMVPGLSHHHTRKETAGNDALPIRRGLGERPSVRASGCCIQQEARPRGIRADDVTREGYATQTAIRFPDVAIRSI